MPHLPRVAILLDTSTSHGRGVLRGIAGFTRAHQLWETFVFKGRLEEYPQGMRNWTGSGVLVKNGNRQILREVEKLDVPFVIIDDIEEQENTPCHVGPDLVRAGRMAAEHFIDHGLRRLAFFGGSFDHPALLIEGYQGKLSEQGLAAELHWREELVNDWETHRKQTAEWLKQLETPAGIFCVDDNQARVVLHCCNDLDIHVPEEIAILGLQNDRTMCELVYPTLSSIDLDSERIGYEAARLLDLRMAGENPPDQPLLIKPRGVMTRLSSEINAVEDPLVAEAMVYVRHNIQNNPTVAQIAEHLVVSRRCFEQRFRQAVRESPGQYLRRARVRQVKQLLATELSLDDIAAKLSFRTVKALSEFFSRNSEVTLSDYRKLKSCD